MKQLEAQIRVQMKIKGLTPYQLSKDTGISQSTLSRWLNGKSEISANKFNQIAEAIGLKILLIGK